MAWRSVSSDYQPAAGEIVRLHVRYKYILAALSVADVRTMLETAGYRIYDVSGAGLGLIPNVLTVELAAPGGVTMSQVGAGVSEAIADSWRAYDVEVTDYEAKQLSLPEPSLNWVVTLVAIAVIGIVAVYFSRRYF